MQKVIYVPVFIKRHFLGNIWNIQQDCLVDIRDFCTGVFLYTILFYEKPFKRE